MARALLKQVAVFTSSLILFTLVHSSGVARSQEKTPAAYKFDEFGDDSAESVLAHLDQFASHLSNNPSLRGFIVGYRREAQPAGSFLRYIHGCREYLVNRRGVPSNSVNVIDGGIRKNTMTELWLVPTGTSAPLQPTPTLLDSEALLQFDRLTLGNDCFSEFDVALPEPADALKFFAGALGVKAGAQGFIVVHPSPHDALRKAEKLARTSKASLVKNFGIAAGRIVTRVMARRPCTEIDLWLAPPNLVLLKTADPQSVLMDEAEEHQFTISRVEFVGNEYTRDNVLRRRIPGLQEGQSFSKAVLRRNLASLSRLKTIKPLGFEDLEVHLNRKEKTIDLTMFVNGRLRSR